MNKRVALLLSLFYVLPTTAHAQGVVVAVPIGGTIETSLAACPAQSCTVRVPDGFTETFTSPIQLGSTTQTVNLVIGVNVTLTCNVIDAAMPPVKVCIVPLGNSTIRGSNFGGQSGGAGGSLIRLATTAKVSSVISSSFPVTGAYQEYFYLSDLTLSGSGSCTETVNDSILHLEQIFVPSSVNNLTIINFCNTVGLHIVGSSGGGGGIGNINVNQVWSAGGNNVGARPCVIESTGGAVSSIQFYGGACESAATNGINVEINGHGHAGGVSGLLFSGHHVENTTAGTGVTGYKITDAHEVLLENVEALFPSDTETAVVSINQSGGSLTENIVVHNLRVSSPTSSIPLIVNNIPSPVETITGGRLNHYSYSTSSSSLGNYWSGNSASVFFGSIITGTLATPAITLPNSGNATFQNNVNGDLTVTLNSGLSAGQNIFLNMQDRGATKWTFQKSSGNSFLLNDGSTSRWGFVPGATAYMSSGGTSDIQFQSLGTPGTGGVSFWSGGVTPAKVASIDGSGNLNLAANNSAFTMTGTTFAALGAPVNGTFVYCRDCTIANPCAAAGGGALAKRLNGLWVCN